MNKSCIGKHKTPSIHTVIDMLPVGRIGINTKGYNPLERNTNFTKEEQRTMLTLWSIFRSPLMIGSELRELDTWTEELLTNRDVLRVLTHGRNAREVKRTEDMIIWKSEDIVDGIYLAIFNISDEIKQFHISLKEFIDNLQEEYVIKVLWEKNVKNMRLTELNITLQAHDAWLIKASQ